MKAEGREYHAFGEVNDFPFGTQIHWRDVPQLGADIYRSLEFLDQLLEMSTSTRILAGVRQPGAGSGYESQLLAALASSVLRPYVTALERATSKDLSNRLRYARTPLFPDGLEYRGMIKGGWSSGAIKQADLDSTEVLATITSGLPQDDARSEALARSALELGIWSRRTASEKGPWRTENPDEEQVQITAERVVDKAREALADETLEEYDPELAARYRQVPLTQTAQERGPGAQRAQFPTAGPVAGSPEEADLVLAQAQRAARGEMPQPRGVTV